MASQTLSVRTNAWQRFRNSLLYHSFTHNRTAMVSATVVLIYILLSVLAPAIAPYDPWDQTQFDIRDSKLPSSRKPRCR